MNDKPETRNPEHGTLKQESLFDSQLDQLDAMLADWTAALISNLEDPTTKGNLDLVQAWRQEDCK